MNTEEREKMAELCHDIWSDWMRWLFDCGNDTEVGGFTILPEKVRRWRRQISTRYDALSDDEKESDRYQADKIFSLLAKRVHCPCRSRFEHLAELHKDMDLPTFVTMIKARLWGEEGKPKNV